MRDNQAMMWGGKSTITSIDMSKLFFSICIVGLHSGICESLPYEMGFWLEKAIFRLAVPAFFTMSGLFLGRKLNDNSCAPKDVIKHYCTRLVYPLIVFEVINIIFEIINSLFAGESIIFIIFKIARSIIAYPYGALWYVQACIVGALLLYPFIKHNKFKIAILLFGCLFLFALICNSYYFLIKGSGFEGIIYWYMRIFISARNGIFVGAFFIGLGIVISHMSFSIEKRQKWKVFIGFIVSYILYLNEIYLLKGKSVADDGSLYLLQTIMIPMLIINIYCCNMDISYKHSEAIRNYSVGIYFLHRPLLACIQLYQNISGNHVEAWSKLLITLIIAYAICRSVYQTKKEPFFTLLK